MRAPFAPSTDVLAHDIYTHDLARSRPPIGRLIVAAGTYTVIGHRQCLSDFPPEMQTGTMGRKGYAVWCGTGVANYAVREETWGSSALQEI